MQKNVTTQFGRRGCDPITCKSGYYVISFRSENKKFYFTFFLFLHEESRRTAFTRRSWTKKALPINSIEIERFLFEEKRVEYQHVRIN